MKKHEPIETTKSLLIVKITMVDMNVIVFMVGLVMVFIVKSSVLLMAIVLMIFVRKSNVNRVLLVMVTTAEITMRSVEF